MLTSFKNLPNKSRENFCYNCKEFANLSFCPDWIEWAEVVQLATMNQNPYEQLKACLAKCSSESGSYWFFRTAGQQESDKDQTGFNWNSSLEQREI